MVSVVSSWCKELSGVSHGVRIFSAAPWVPDRQSSYQGEFYGSGLGCSITLWDTK